MTGQLTHKTTGSPWRAIGWSIPVVLLLLPLVTGAPWTLSDYLAMAVLLGIVGATVELAVRRSSDGRYRAGAALAVVTGFLLVWVNLAVGFLGDEGNRANLIFLGVLAVAAGGAAVARAAPAGMARAMVATAAAQVVAGIGGWAAGWASPGSAGVYEVALGTTLFAGAWLTAAALFRAAARRADRVRPSVWARVG